MNFLRTMPRKALISLALLLLGLLLAAVLVPVLGGVDEEAANMSVRLKKDIDDTRRAITQVDADRKYVVAHQEEYEALLKSDRLVPHSRRAAVLELQRIAERNGTTLDWSFVAVPTNSLTTVQAQVASGAYRVAVEQIQLKVGAATDGAIYRFIEDLYDSFPGAAVTQSVSLARPPSITPQMMNLLSQGKDSKIVTGEVNLLWRTAQAQEQKGALKK